MKSSKTVFDMFATPPTLSEKMLARWDLMNAHLVECDKTYDMLSEALSLKQQRQDELCRQRWEIEKEMEKLRNKMK